ncbi:MAG: aromatic ring-hydroxylating dioxygenase subunit alpha [Rivularia sp. (in: cyanobacteria)]|jgi:phenylpropionate dioxygenase-like ring-hydroxylating dioxygenase large terminal subunit
MTNNTEIKMCEDSDILWNDWHVVCCSEDLLKEKILTFRLLGQNLVLWRDSQNNVFAWENRCPHRGATFDRGWVKENKLVCPYHGLEFANSGQCVYVPAHPDQPIPKKACVNTYNVEEKYGFLWVCLNEPKQDIPAFPEWLNSDFRKFLAGPYYHRSSAFRTIENFFDCTHLPFVHPGLLAEPSHPQISEYQVTTHDSGIDFGEVKIWEPSMDGSENGEYVYYKFRILRPLTVDFRRGLEDQRMVGFFTVSPVDEEECIAWMWMFVNYGEDIPDEQMQNFLNTIIEQDIPIIESQSPKKLPLNFVSEISFSSDNASVAYRKWLKNMGIAFGVI